MGVNKSILFVYLGVFLLDVFVMLFLVRASSYEVSFSINRIVTDNVSKNSTLYLDYYLKDDAVCTVTAGVKNLYFFDTFNRTLNLTSGVGLINLSLGRLEGTSDVNVSYSCGGLNQ
jgi:hypothetical protein